MDGGFRTLGRARPFAFFFLVLPYGISGGFATVTLPYALTGAGFPVAVSGAIVALALSSNVWRFLWGPVADLTFTLRRWYLGGVLACAATLVWLSLMPLRPNAVGLLSAVTFVSQLAATFVVLPLGGLMAQAVRDEEKGRAGGWYQAGNLGGGGVGGGAGVWLATHFSLAVAGVVLAVAMLACLAALVFVPDIRPPTSETVAAQLRSVGHDLLSMVRSPVPLLTMALVVSPIGACAASNLWSAIAPDWRASADLVALVTGVLSGVVSAVGCVAGGWIADRVGRWWAFFGAGTATALVAVAFALAPRTPASYTTGILVYTLAYGWANAAFSAIVLYAIGRSTASAKYAILSSVGNLPVAYMTAFDGWLHDRSGTTAMLMGEAMLGGIAIIFGLAALRAIREPVALPKAPSA